LYDLVSSDILPLGKRKTHGLREEASMQTRIRMLDKALSKVRCAPVIFLSCVVLSASALAQSTVAMQQLSLTPEATKEMQNSGQAMLLVNTDLQGTSVPAPKSDQQQIIVYFTSSISTSPAQKAAQTARGKGFAKAYWLSGTPSEWVANGLRLPGVKLPSGPIPVSVNDLAAAMKDDGELQLIDLRGQGDSRYDFPHATKVMPHEVQAASARWSKSRWLVLIDGGDRVATPIAEQLRADGFELVCVLDGGYPAWTAANTKRK
jgi:rhodanese-related sulfurtransferase